MRLRFFFFLLVWMVICSGCISKTSDKEAVEYQASEGFLQGLKINLDLSQELALKVNEINVRNKTDKFALSLGNQEVDQVKVLALDHKRDSKLEALLGKPTYRKYQDYLAWYENETSNKLEVAGAISSANNSASGIDPSKGYMVNMMNLLEIDKEQAIAVSTLRTKINKSATALRETQGGQLSAADLDSIAQYRRAAFSKILGNKSGAFLSFEKEWNEKNKDLVAGQQKKKSLRKQKLNNSKAPFIKTKSFISGLQANFEVSEQEAISMNKVRIEHTKRMVDQLGSLSGKKKQNVFEQMRKRQIKEMIGAKAINPERMKDYMVWYNGITKAN